MLSGTSLAEKDEKLAWNKLIYNSFDKIIQKKLPGGLLIEKSYLIFMKHTIGDYILIKSFASHSVNPEHIVGRTIHRILSEFGENSEKVIQYFTCVLKELLKNCEEEKEAYVKNRVIFTATVTSNMKAGIKELNRSILHVAKLWGIQNFDTDSAYIEKLKIWANEHSHNKKLLLKSKNSAIHQNQNQTKMQKLNKELGFYENLVFYSLVFFTVASIAFFQFLEPENALILSAVSFGFTGFSVIAGTIGWMTAWQPRRKLIEINFHEFNDRTIHFSIKNPKPENNYRMEIMPSIQKMADVDYSTSFCSEKLEPKQEFSISKRMLRMLGKQETKMEQPAVPASKSPLLEIIDDFHIRFTDNNVIYDAQLSEYALPEGKKGDAIIKAFKKGLMPREQKPHSIVKTKKTEGCLFKIRTSYDGRMKSHTRFTDPKHATVDFDVYDPKPHRPSSYR